MTGNLLRDTSCHAMLCIRTQQDIFWSYPARSVSSHLSRWALIVQCLYLLTTFLSIADSALHCTVLADPEKSALLSPTLPSSSITTSALLSFRRQHQDPPIQSVSVPSILSRPDILYAVFNSCSRIQNESYRNFDFNQYIFFFELTFVKHKSNDTSRACLK